MQVGDEVMVRVKVNEVRVDKDGTSYIVQPVSTAYESWSNTVKVKESDIVKASEVPLATWTDEDEAEFRARHLS